MDGVLIVYRRIHWGGLLGLVLSASPILAESPVQLNQWAGEALAPGEGAIFLFFEPSSKAKEQAEKIESAVTVTVANLVSKKTYVFSQGIGTFPVPLVWRLPAGKYAVRSLKALGSDGKVYNARFQKKEGKRFLVRKLYMSHLSSWMVFTVSGETLKVGIRKQKTTYKPTDTNTLRSFKGIVNGLTGKLEAQFEQPEALAQATEAEHASPTQMRKSVSLTRSIAMFFRLNLFKNNSYAPMIANVIAGADQKLRKCYTEALDGTPNLKGEIVLRFAIAKESGTFKKIAVSKTQIADSELQECLILNLKQLQLPAAKSMLGELVLSFDFSD